MNEAASDANNLVTMTEGPALSATSDVPVVETRDPPARTQETEVEQQPEKRAEPNVDEIIADPAEIDPNKLRKKDLQGRFKELTTARDRELERANKAEAELAEIRKKEAEAAAAEEARRLNAPRPKREDFGDPNAYDDALIAWSREQGKREGSTETQQAQQREAQEKAFRETVTSHNGRVAEFSADVADYAEVTGNPHLPITPIMSQAIITTDNGPAVAYYLGKNPAEAARIAALPPGQQVFEMGKLSATVTKPVPKVSAAPAPINRLRSTGPASGRDVEAMNGDEYYNHRMAERRAAN